MKQPNDVMNEVEKVKKDTIINCAFNRGIVCFDKCKYTKLCCSGLDKAYKAGKESV